MKRVEYTFYSLKTEERGNKKAKIQAFGKWKLKIEN
jgi:hypothetical protein